MTQVLESSASYSSWLANLSEEDFDEVANAAETILMIQQALSNDGISILGELLRDQGDAPIEVWEHYPADDFRDPNSGAMFYYHAHSPEEWKRDEHGHFHLFVRPSSEGEFTHVMALSMNSYGVPNGIFTTNGWVTDEVMLPAEEVIQLVDERWEIARARPSWLVVQWMNAVIKIVRPKLEELLKSRDQAIGWTNNHKFTTDIFNDLNTHILSEIPLDFLGMLKAVQAEVRFRLPE